MYICIFSPSSRGIQVLDSGFFNGGTQPRTQASSRYPSYQRRLGTECEIAENDWERGWVGLAFRVPIVSGIPDSTSKNFPDSGFSQGRISQIPEFPYVGWHGIKFKLKSVRGTQSVVAERRTRKTVEKKTPDAPPAKEKKIKSHVYLRSMLDKKSWTSSVVKTTSSITEVVQKNGKPSNPFIFDSCKSPCPNYSLP